MKKRSGRGEWEGDLYDALEHFKLRMSSSPDTTGSD